MKHRFALAALAALGVALVVYLAVERATERDAMTALAGRVLMVGFDGRVASDDGVRRTVGQLRRGEIAGVMYLRRNVRGEGQVKALNRLLTGAADRTPLVALDQEGGRVSRLGRRSGFRRTPSAFSIGRTGPEQAMAAYERMAQGLRDWGFNVNFGPVVDLHRRDNPIIGRLGRAYAAEPETVVPFARAFVHAHAAAGIATALKHFPGHGSSLRDTHRGSADVTETWSPAELDPFRALVAEAPLVMTGHIVNRQLGSGAPATLAPEIVTGLLRERLGFTGVVVSDDLQMDAISDRYDEPEAAERAMRAGVDLLLFANDGRVDPNLVTRVTEHLARVARRDPGFERRLREAGDRVDRLRERLGAQPVES